jgi:predicted RNase H-like HicB family nuclease
MPQTLIVVSATYDPEANVWWASSGDMPGLLLEGATIEELREKISGAVLDLLEASGDTGPEREITVQIVAHTETRVHVPAAAAA